MQAAEVMLWEFDVCTGCFMRRMNLLMVMILPKHSLSKTIRNRFIRRIGKSGDYPIGYAQWLRLSV